MCRVIVRRSRRPRFSPAALFRPRPPERDRGRRNGSRVSCTPPKKQQRGGRGAPCKLLSTNSLSFSAEIVLRSPVYKTRERPKSGHLRGGTGHTVRGHKGGAVCLISVGFCSPSVENQKQRGLLLAEMLQILVEMLHAAPIHPVRPVFHRPPSATAYDGRIGLPRKAGTVPTRENRFDSAMPAGTASRPAVLTATGGRRLRRVVQFALLFTGLRFLCGVALVLGGRPAGTGPHALQSLVHDVD